MEVTSVSVESPDLADMTKEEYRTLMSLIGTVAWQLVNSQGMDRKEARKQAADEVGSMLNPAVSGKVLESAIGKARQRLFAAERAAGFARARERRDAERLARLLEAERLKVDQKNKDITAMSLPVSARNRPTVRTTSLDEVDALSAEKALREKRLSEHESRLEDKAKRQTVIDLYRSWVSDHDWVPLDQVLAHFVGKSPEAFSAARTKLAAEEGYAFTKNGKVWIVNDRPSKAKYTEEDLRKAVETALKSVRK